MTQGLKVVVAASSVTGGGGLMAQWRPYCSMVALPCLDMCWAGSSNGGRGRSTFLLLRLNVQLRDTILAFLAFHHCVFLAGLRDTNAPWMELDLGIPNFLFFEAN